MGTGNQCPAVRWKLAGRFLVAGRQVRLRMSWHPRRTAEPDSSFGDRFLIDSLRVARFLMPTAASSRGFGGVLWPPNVTALPSFARAERPPCRAVNGPLDTTAATRAAIGLLTSGPWRLVELDLIDLPNAAWARQEGQRYRAADRQQLGRPDNGHAGALAGRAGVARAAAAETRGGEAAIGPAIKVGWLPRAVAARAVDVQL
jgi:hypothetical protein